MNQEIKKCAKRYLEDIKIAYDLILEGMHFAIPTSPIDWIQNYPAQKGEFELRGKNQFFLHGFGCDFKNENLQVSWDFDMNGGITGLTSWMFSDYIKRTRPDLTEFHDWLIIENELKVSILKGEVEKRDSHYYLIENPTTKPFSHLHI